MSTRAASSPYWGPTVRESPRSSRCSPAVHHADAGQITVDGHPLGSHAASRSMSFLHQDLGLVEWMTVAESIALSIGYPRRGGLISWRRTRERCADALRIVAGHLDPDAPIARLSPAERSLVAIARALAAHAKLIVLDEPTARLPAADCARLFRVLHALRDQGHGILYVSHRLDEVYKVADTFAVLRDGHLVSHGPLAGRGPARLVHDIVGEELADYRPATVAADGPAVLTLDGVRTMRRGTRQPGPRARGSPGPGRTLGRRAHGPGPSPRRLPGPSSTGASCSTVSRTARARSPTPSASGWAS